MSIRHARMPASAGVAGLLLMLSLGAAGPVRADNGGGTGDGTAATAPPGDMAVYPIVSGFGDNGVTTGPDGNIWYTVPSRNLVGVASPDGAPIATYSVPGTPGAIVSGPDRALWFQIGQYLGTEPAIGELATDGTLSVFPLTAADGLVANGLAAGPDGNLWYTVSGASDGTDGGTDNGSVASMTPQGAVTHYPLPIPFRGLAHDIAAGPDGNLWFIGQSGDNTLSSQIGEVTPSGTVTMYSLPHGAGGPGGIAAGPDGRLWFTEDAAAGGTSAVGSIGTGGDVRFVPLAAADLRPGAITTGADGRLWFTEGRGPGGAATGGIVGMATDGTATVYPSPPGGSPSAIAPAADGDLWFTDAAFAALGRLTTTKPHAALVSVASDSNPALYGQAGGLAATVTPVAAGSPAPAGTVTFTPAGADSVTVPLVDGVATLPLATLSRGVDSVSALYNGDADYGPVSFQAFQQTVNRAATATTLTASANPAQAGRDVTITAAVAAAPAGGVPEGSVTFTIDGSDQTVPVRDGAATTTLWSPTVGTHAIDASYTPDGIALNHNNYLPSSATMTQTVSAVTPDGCPCSVFPTTATPARPDSGDAFPIELGMKIRTLKKGDITGVRFYKAAANTGPHTGSLWGADGRLLATGTFQNESASGWQTLVFDTPVPAVAGLTYVVSYHTTTGHYAYDGGYFENGNVGTGPVLGLATGVDGNDGVYAYGTASTFPTGSYAAANYWVDAVFDTQGVPTTAPTVVSETPAADAAGVSRTTTATATFSAPLAGPPVMRLSAVTGPDAGAEVPGNTVYDAASGTATFVPTTQLPGNTTFGVSVAGVDVWGQPQDAVFTWSFTTGTTAPSYACPCGLFGAGDAPAVANSGDANSLEVGMRFTPQVDGQVTGVRFYKGSLNTGTHTGSLWSSDGTLLATGTFTGETAGGWQTLSFATPVPVTAGTTYVASYHAPNGDYSYTAGYFGYLHSRYPLSAPRALPQSGNGVYAYGASTLFPHYGSAGGTNYWIDVVFTSSG